MANYEPPGAMKQAFSCPYCDAYAKQTWNQAFQATFDRNTHTVMTATCSHCYRFSIWHDEAMVFPDAPLAEPPNPDLSDRIRDIYAEAQSIVSRSPRGAAALLRLCVQLLCIQLGEKGKKIDDDIANLVSKGRLRIEIQQALDILRVIGNNAVHPGEIDIDDDRDTAMSLFRYLNLIADALISEPRRIQEAYNALPQGARDAVQKRDATP